MAVVTLAKALKLKNRQVQNITALKEIIAKYNSGIEGNTRPFDIKETLKSYEQAIERLVAIKSAIQIANVPITPLVFEMAELRGMVAFLKILNTQAGKAVCSYQGDMATYDAVIDASEAASLIERLETRLDTLQDEVDRFNATTQITLPD